MSPSPRSQSELPTFRYHPEPVATGSVKANPEATCPCCGQQTGWAYLPTPYGPGEQPKHLCPWCIADDSAAGKFGAKFVVDITGKVPAAVVEELARRTPGFLTWQEPQWLTHCDDAAAYVSQVGWDRLKDLPDAQAAILADGWSENALRTVTEAGDLTAYLFRCLHCGTHPADVDAG